MGQWEAALQMIGSLSGPLALWVVLEIQGVAHELCCTGWVSILDS